MLQRPAGPASLPPPLVRKVALDHPVDGVAVAGDSGVWIVHGDRLAEGGFEAAGRDVAVDEQGVVWVHSDRRVVGFGPDHTRGRTLEEAGGAIRALAAGHGALWVGGPAGLLRVDFAALP